MILRNYDIIIINSSGGKDSLCALDRIMEMADVQGYPKSRIHVSHQDLGEVEWVDTKDLVRRQAKYYGVTVHFSKRRDKTGYNETLLEYVERRKMWPSNAGARVVTKLTKDLGDCKVLQVFGFRADESPSRKRKEILSINKNLTTKRRTVHDFLPIHHWSNEQVWQNIRSKLLPYHFAYDLGMPRLSCCFCIFAPFDALVVAGKANPGLLDKYCDTEDKIGHT